MSRSVTLPPFSCWTQETHEPALLLDREPLGARLPLRSTMNQNKEEYPMTKPEFVAYMIQHSEDFPDVSEIDLDTARSVLSMLAPDKRIPSIAPDEFLDLWNSLVHDPAVMDIE